MVNVHNWLDSTKPPNNPSKYDMIFGIGCMNELLLELTDKMADLINKANRNATCRGIDILEKFNKESFGKQMGILKKQYDGADIQYSKLEHLRKERNYFIHTYRTANMSSNDALRLKNLINLIKKMIGQLTNAKQRTVKENKTAKNKEKDKLRKAIITAVRNCPEDDDGYVLLSAVGIRLSQTIGRPKSSLSKLIEEFGWEIYEDECNHNIKYLKTDKVY